MAGTVVVYLCLAAALLGQGGALKCNVCSDLYEGNTTVPCDDGTATLLQCPEPEDGMAAYCFFFTGTLTNEEKGLDIVTTRRDCVVQDTYVPNSKCELRQFSEEAYVPVASSILEIDEEGLICLCNDKDGCNGVVVTSGSPASTLGTATSRAVTAASLQAVVIGLMALAARS